MDTQIKDQLGRAMISQKQNHWPIYPKNDWKQFQCRNDFSTRDYNGGYMFYLSDFLSNFLTIKGAIPLDQGFLKIRENNPNNFLSEYTALQPILDKYYGEVILAGGAMTSQFIPGDVDLYFINSERRQEIIADCLEIVEKHHGKVTVIKTDWATTFQTGPIAGPIAGPCYYKYQFIMKDFSSIGHVLGSFDLFASMVAYDGKEVWATDTGAWAWTNNIIVVDISRVSSSFGRRIGKYSRRHFDVVLVGLSNDRQLKFSHYFAQDVVRVVGFELVYQLCTDGMSVGTIGEKRRDPYQRGNIKFPSDEFYLSGHRKRCYPIIDPKTETLLRLARKDRDNVWSNISKDTFNLIISLIPYI